jgi:hypothetical protein
MEYDGMDLSLHTKARVEPPATASLSFAQALESPCRDCIGLCCCYLPLQVVPARNLMEVDYIRYLLAFPRLQAGFGVDGQWSIYYTMPCRHFDAGTHHCRVHGTPAQPRTCVAYNEHDCWYQRAISPASKGFLLFDRRRFEELLGRMTFDKERSIASVPSWDEMVSLCDQIPLTPSWDELLKSSSALPPVPPAVAADRQPAERPLSEVMRDPCEGCPAPCCRHLYFPLPVPAVFMQIDYIQFCLNFPGVECAVSPTSWWLLVRAECEFLQADERRCGLFGRPERPLRCVHLNQWDCGQYRQLFDPQPATLRRLDRDAFADLTTQLRFDDDGRITQSPSLFEQ